MAEYQDKELECQIKGCTEKFVWSAKDQEFFAQNGWGAPKRCKTHRAEKKQFFAKKDAEREQKEHRESSPFHPKNIKGYPGGRDKDLIGAE